MFTSLFLRFIPLCLFLGSTCFSFSQNYVWAKGEGGIGNEVANSVAVDEAGNVYLTGNLAGMGNFSGTIYQGKGVYDVVIVKYDAAGNLVWLKTAGGDENDQGNVIRYFNGYLYVGGYFTDTAWFENTLLLGKGEADAFVAKYDLSGNLIWVKSGGGSNFDYVSSLDLDAQGNIYAAGSYESNMLFDTTHLTTPNLFTESFFCKYNNNGQLQWAKSTQGNNANLISGLAHDRQNSFYVTGFFGSNFSMGNATVSSNSPSYDIFLARLDNDGNIKWLNTAGSNYEDAGNAVTVDGEGNPIMTGYFAGIASFGTNQVTYYDYNDVFVAKYDSAGNNLWVRAGKGLQLDVGYGVTTDASNNVFATGVFQVSTTFSGHTITGADRDIFIVSYDPDGNLRWIDKAGGENTDCGLGVAVKPNGNVALCGYYIHTCTFGNIALHYADGNDLFVAEYHPPVVNSIVDGKEEEDFAAVPNPISDYIRIRSESYPASNAHWRLFDISGKLLREDDFFSNCTIGTSNLEKGVYFVEIMNPFAHQTIRVVKQ